MPEPDPHTRKLSERSRASAEAAQRQPAMGTVALAPPPFQLRSSHPEDESDAAETLPVQRRELAPPPAVQREETGGDPLAGLEQLIDSGHTDLAYKRLSEAIPAFEDRKRYLHDPAHDLLRIKLLKSIDPYSGEPVSVAESRLYTKPVQEAVALILAWYPAEAEQTAFYARLPDLHSRMVKEVDPYSGQPIGSVINTLVEQIRNGDFSGSNRVNPQFHKIHLLAPDMPKKMELYRDRPALFEAASDKFDPFTGMSKGDSKKLLSLFEDFLGRNVGVNEKEAVQAFNLLKALPEEQRQAFFAASGFVGKMIGDDRMDAYYKTHFKKQYKKLDYKVHTLLYFFMEADFASNLSSNMPAEALNSRKGGFDRGLDSSLSGEKNKETRQSDQDKLLERLADPAIWDQAGRLDLLLGIAVQADLQAKVLDLLRLRAQVTPAQESVLNRNGFSRASAAEPWQYQDRDTTAKGRKSTVGFALGTLLDLDNSFTGRELNLDVDLRKLQETKSMHGSVAGLRFGASSKADKQRWDPWLRAQVAGSNAKSTLDDNLQDAPDSDGKLFVSIDESGREANVFASTLPVESINYFSAGSLIRAGATQLNGLRIQITWDKDPADPECKIKVYFELNEVAVNDLELIAPKSTMAIGFIGMNGIRAGLESWGNPGIDSISGAIKHGKLVSFSLSTLLPGFIKVLQSSVMVLADQFKGATTKVNQDNMMEAVRSSFGSKSQFDGDLSFSALNVRDIYDTTAGFMDNLKVGGKDKDGNDIRQHISLKSNVFWLIDTQFALKSRIRELDELIGSSEAALQQEIGELGALIELHSANPAQAAPYLQRKEAAEARLKQTQREIRLCEGLMKHYKKQFAAAQDDQEKAEIKKNYQREKAKLERLRNAPSLKMRLESAIREQEAKLAATEDAAETAAIKSKIAALQLQLVQLASTLQGYQREISQAQADMAYADSGYHEDARTLKSGKLSEAEQYRLRERMAAFEGKYKSYELGLNLKQIEVGGGDYLKNIIISSLKGYGFEAPQLDQVQNISIGSVQAKATIDSTGASGQKGKPDVQVKNIRIPKIVAPVLFYRTDGLSVEGSGLDMQEVSVSLFMELPDNHIASPAAVKYGISGVFIQRAKLDSLHVTTPDGKTIDIPKGQGAELQRVQIKDLNFSEEGLDTIANIIPKEKTLSSIRLIIGDIKTAGQYSQGNAQEGLKAGFAIDTTGEESKAPAIDVAYDGKEKSVRTRLDIPQVQLPSLLMRSPELDLDAVKNGVTLKGLTADVKVILPKPDTSTGEQTPTEIEIHQFGLRELTAQGIHATMRKAPEAGKDGKPAAKGGTRHVDLPDHEPVSIKGISISGLGLSLQEQTVTDEKTGKTGTKTQASLRSLDGKQTSVNVGPADLAGISYSEKNARSRVTLAARLTHGAFDSIKLEAIDRGARSYSLDEFFAFFGTAELGGLDLGAAVSTGKTSAELRVKGKKDARGNNIPISVKQSGEDLKIRMPLAAIQVPQLHVEAGGTVIDLPRAQKGKLSAFNNVDVKLTVKLGEDPVTVLIDEIDVAEFVSYGLSVQHSAAADDPDAKLRSLGLNFSKDKPLTVKGLRLGGFQVKGSQFGISDKGAFADLTSLDAQADRLQAGIAGGSFLADKGVALSTGSLGVGIGKDGSAAFEINNAALNLPNLSITTVDKAGKTSMMSLGDKDMNILNQTLSAAKISGYYSPNGDLSIQVDQPKIRNFHFRMPLNERQCEVLERQFLDVAADLTVNGSLTLANGTYKDMALDPTSKEAYVLQASEGASVQLSNVVIQYNKAPDTTKKPKAKPQYTAAQQSLLKLEPQIAQLERDIAQAQAEYELYSMPAGPESPMPIDMSKAMEALERMRSLEAQLKPKKAEYERLSGVARAEAGKEADSSGLNEYVNAAGGNVRATLKMFGGQVDLAVKQGGGRNYAVIDNATLSDTKFLIAKAIRDSASLSIWNDPNLKSAADSLLWLAVNYADAQIRLIAEGKGYEALATQLERAAVTSGPTSGGKMFGIHLDINFIRGLEWFDKDKYELYDLAPITALQPSFTDRVDLYQLIRHVGFVSGAVPKQSSIDASAEAARTGYDFKSFTKDVNDELGIGLDKAKLSKSANLLLAYVMDTVLDQIIAHGFDGLDVDAQVTAKPQDAISFALKKYGLGTFGFDKGSDTISGIHFRLGYDARKKSADATLESSSRDSATLEIPGGTYETAAQTFKASYGKIRLGKTTLHHAPSGGIDQTKLEIGPDTFIEQLRLAVKR